MRGIHRVPTLLRNGNEIIPLLELNLERYFRATTICHYHHHNHHYLSLSSSQPPPSVTIIITGTTTCHYHHHHCCINTCNECVEEREGKLILLAAVWGEIWESPEPKTAGIQKLMQDILNGASCLIYWRVWSVTCLSRRIISLGISKLLFNYLSALQVNTWTK